MTSGAPSTHFIGPPCLHGHSGERFVSNRACVECSRKHTARGYKNNRERRLQQSRDWRKRNLERSREIDRNSKSQNKDKVLAGNKKSRAEWRQRDPEAYRAYKRRGARLPEPTRPCPARCECCGVDPSTLLRAKTMHLDHDHITGIFRGWLCTNCNTGMGKLGDNKEGLMKALVYLEKAERT